MQKLKLLLSYKFILIGYDKALAILRATMPYIHTIAKLIKSLKHPVLRIICIYNSAWFCYPSYK